MRPSYAWLTAVILLFPAFLLAFSGIVHLRNGAAVDSAFPVPLALSTDRAMPQLAYRDAAESLSHANSRDGETLISLAEARYRSGEVSGDVLTTTQNGLMAAPASPEGWAFYAEELMQQDPDGASKALTQAFTLAPHDYFWAGRRAQIAARLWESLDSETRVSALSHVRILWQESNLRDGLLPLLANADGAKLVTQAFVHDPDSLRALNRWVSNRRRQLQAQPQ